MTVFEWALPLRDDGRAGEPDRSRRMSLVAVSSSARHKPSGPGVRIASVTRLAWPPDSTGLRDSSRSSRFLALGACARKGGEAPADRRTCGRSRPLVVRLGPPSLNPGLGDGLLEDRRAGRGRAGIGRAAVDCGTHAAVVSGAEQMPYTAAPVPRRPGRGTSSEHLTECPDARLRSCFAGWLNSRSEEMSPVSVFKFPSDTDDHGLARYFVLRLDRTHEDAGDVHGV